MLDLNELIAKQNAGNELLTTLQEDESVILQNYGLMAVQGLIEMAGTMKEPAHYLVFNAFRNGICLGLSIQVANGVIQERR